MKNEQAVILGTEFDAVTLDQTMTIVDRMLDTKQRGIICTVNVAILMMMRSDSLLRRVIANSALTVADGQPVVWISGWFGARLPERVTGVDLVEEFARLAARKKYSIYLLGATDDVVEQVASRLTGRHPGLLIAGKSNGYFTEQQNDEVVERIQASGADILLVAMGVPRQEKFLDDFFTRTKATIALPVGGSFEVIAGRKKRAPLWVQKVGLEWLYRLAQEPGRLWKRYLFTNIQFVTLVCAALFKNMLGKRAK